MQLGTEHRRDGLDLFLEEEGDDFTLFTAVVFLGECMSSSSFPSSAYDGTMFRFLDVVDMVDMGEDDGITREGPGVECRRAAVAIKLPRPCDSYYFVTAPQKLKAEAGVEKSKTKRLDH